MQQRHSNKQLISAWAAPVVLVILLVGAVRANPVKVARLHATAEKESGSWFEGWSSRVHLRGVRWPMHRPPSGKQPFAMMIKASSRPGQNMGAWKTAPVPDNHRGKFATFLMTAAMSSSGDGRRFDVFVNEHRRFTYFTMKGPNWTISGEGGGQLTFTTVAPDRFGDYYGYLSITAPRQWLTPGQPLAIKIQAEPHGPQTKDWTFVFECPDSLAYFHTQEKKAVYHNLGRYHAGWVSTQVAGPTEKVAGKKVALRSGNVVIGEAVLKKAAGGIAVAQIPTREEMRGRLWDTVTVVLDGKEVDTVRGLAAGALPRLRNFLNEPIRPKRYLLPPGEFPRVNWMFSNRVRDCVGDFTLQVTYYDRQLNPVAKAEKPGRYGAVIEGKTPFGYPVVRYVTMFCYDQKWSRKIEADPHPFPSQRRFWRTRTHEEKQRNPLDRPVPADTLTAVVNYLERHDYVFFPAIVNAPAVKASYWAAQHETAGKKMPAYLASPWNRDRQWHVRLKRRHFGLENKYPALDRPIWHKQAVAPVLKTGDPASVGYKKEHIAAIRAAADAWGTANEAPLAVLVARKGVIVFHQAYGAVDGTPMTVDTPTWMASITKLLTGCLLMEFVDQGLIGLDDPVKKFIPEFDQAVKKDLTIRHLMTHLNDIGREHADWGGDWNSALENVIGHKLPQIKAAEVHYYNGLGYALAGKILERVSGRALPMLFQECLLRPLGAKHTIIEGSSWDCTSTCLDMARIGQMLLNRGSYGEYEFFSKKSFTKMLPIKLSTIAPGVTGEWGIGIHGPAGGHTIGHGGSSGALLHIDLKLELLYVIAQNTPGKGKKDEFVRACINPLDGQ